MAKDDVNNFGSNITFPKSDDQEHTFTSPDDGFDDPYEKQFTLDDYLFSDSEQLNGLPKSYSRETLVRGAWVEVDLKAIRYNVRQAVRAVGPRCKVMAIVKADAYGHGAVQCANAALQSGADMLGVATVEEGINLREADISCPILILSQPPQTAIQYIIEFGLIPAIYTQKFALDYAEQADRAKKRAPFHLAIDTGMNRIGVFYTQAAQFLQDISFHRALKYEGTFTHFATADEESDWDFRIQLKRFNQALEAIRNVGFNPGVVHAANSAAIFRYKEAHFDMVRLGICMYGLSPSPATRRLVELHPAMSVKARISHVKEPLLGEGVSYGLNYRVASKIQIATLPLGYADGVRRELQSRFKVLCNNRVCHQVGNICMDQMMIEVPLGRTLDGRRGGAEVGDEVVIIGRQGDLAIDAETMADALHTITYEITCLFGLRLPKVYLDD